MQKLKKKSTEETSLQFNLIALLVLTVFTVIFAYAVRSRKSEAQKPKAVPHEQVMGQETHKTPIEDFNTVSSAIQNGAEELKNTAQAGFESVLGVATESATKFVLENTAGSIATQINKLPENQKDELKKQICK